MRKTLAAADDDDDDVDDNDICYYYLLSVLVYTATVCISVRFTSTDTYIKNA